MRRGDVRRIEGAEGHSWSQLHPFPVWGAAGRGQAWGHAGPVLRLGPGAGSELPPACVCVYKTACVFLCELREEGRRHICFWSPQKALLSGPGGAGVPVEHGVGAGGQVSGHTVCVGYNVVRCGLFYHQLFTFLPCGLFLYFQNACETWNIPTCYRAYIDLNIYAQLNHFKT